MLDFEINEKVIEILRKNEKIETQFKGYATLNELRKLNQSNKLEPGVYCIVTSGSYIYFDGKEARIVTYNGLY